MPKVPYPYEVNGKLVMGNGSLIPILHLIWVVVFNSSQFWIVYIFTTDQTFTEFISGHKTSLQTNCQPINENLIIYTNLKCFFFHYRQWIRLPIRLVVMFSSFAVNKLLFAFKLSSCFQYLSILNSLLVTKLPSKPIASLLMKTWWFILILNIFFLWLQTMN